MVNFPLTMSFKIAAINPQVRVTDAAGRLIAYGKQRAFKLKEDITVYEDEQQTRPLYRMQADRVLDWSASYHIVDAHGAPLGALRREGARSMWKATYHIAGPDGATVALFHEENGWVRAGDFIFGELPFIGILSGYIFSPAYLFDHDGQTLIYAKKQPAFLEGRFKVEQRQPLPARQESLVLASTILALMLERWRG